MNKYKAAFYRGGSSKGLFFRPTDLPADPSERDAVLVRLLGSPDPYGRQLDGMGGGLSSVSKAMIVDASDRDDVDLDYTFAQIAVDTPVADYAANCGNLTAAIAPFGLLSGALMVDAQHADGRHTVRLYNTNTRKRVDVTLDLSAGQHEPAGSYAIAGVAGHASRIDLDFIDPAGSLTAGLLPTGNSIDRISVDGKTFEVSLVDATSPVVFVAGPDFGLMQVTDPSAIENDDQLMEVLDAVRRQAGVLMGIAASPQAVPLVNPKIALVFEPADYRSIDGVAHSAEDHGIGVEMLSMGRVHRAVTLTGSMCLAAATHISGSIPDQLRSRSVRAGEVSMAHPSGISHAHAESIEQDGRIAVRRASVARTARLLMEGHVYG